MTFEWSELKSERNKAKHRVSFSEAVSVFKDGLGRIMSDPDHSLDEERFILLGVSSKIRLLVVCFCEKESDVIRLISARKADKLERKHYEENHYA